MKKLSGLLVLGLLGLTIVGCGGASGLAVHPGSVASTASVSSSPTSAVLPSPDLRGDSDSDATEDPTPSERHSYHDRDDARLVASSHEAETYDMLTVAHAVYTYYAALASADGAKACSMLSPGLASSAAKDYGEAPGPSYLRGARTCPAIIGLLSKHYRARLDDAVTVTGMRISGNNAFVVLRSKSPAVSDLNLERHDGVWKLVEFIGEYDRDDSSLVAAVQAAGTEEIFAVAATVERYYAALRAGEGARACSMFFPAFARSVPAEYGREPGPLYLRGGRTCPAIIKLLSKYDRARLVDPVTVTAVHIYGKHHNGALALLGSKTLPASNFNLEREGNEWKVVALFADFMP